MSLGFSYEILNNVIHIYRNGKTISVIGGKKAHKFLLNYNLMSEKEIQEQLARLTGNYKRGNERQSRHHYRNQA